MCKHNAAQWPDAWQPRAPFRKLAISWKLAARTRTERKPSLLSRAPESARQIPGPRGHVLFGSLPDLKQDPLGFYQRCAQQYGPVTRLRWGLSSVPHYLVTHPDDVEHVLHRNQRNYPKGETFTKPMGTLAGQGVFSSDGDIWRRERRFVQPVFHPERLLPFETTILDAAEKTVQRWQTFSDTNQNFDLAAEMTSLTLRIICQTLFGSVPSGELDSFTQAIRTGTRYIRYRMTHPFAPPLQVPTKTNRDFLSARRLIDRFLFTLIAERQSTTAAGDDVLARLLIARDETTGQAMSQQQVRDELITLLIAGHETLASSLSWTWYLLMQNPAQESVLRAELHQILGKRNPRTSDLAKLPFLRGILEESMRLYPPLWSIRRQAIEDDCVGGYDIPAGSIIILCQYVTHRHPDFWEYPERFDPTRFTPERTAARHRFAYFPFGLGARQCVGNHMAMMEGMLILARLVQGFRPTRVSQEPVEPDPSAALRPKQGILVKVRSV
jgi:cytochrome P450